jgi:hypothetical protein
MECIKFLKNKKLRRYVVFDELLQKTKPFSQPIISIQEFTHSLISL